MRNILLALALGSAILQASAQAPEPAAEKAPATWYAGVYASLSSGDGLQSSAYPSVEVGRSQGITTLALNLGRRNFEGSEDGEKASYYFYEPKVSISKNIADNVQGYFLFGAGGYFDTERYLIEYGLGANWAISRKSSVCVQASNWDGSDYVTFGVSRTF